jgi:sulfur carrier protein
MSEVNITLNGEPRQIEENTTVSALLEQLGMGGRPVVVELNKEALFPRQFAETVVPNQAIVEIVSIVAGG